MLQSGALTWWNTLVWTRGRAIAIAQPWEDLKKLLMEEYCPGNAINKLKEESWNHVMIGADVDKYTTRFHKLARLVPRTVTLESKRIDRYIQGLASAIRRNNGNQPVDILEVHGERPEGNLKQLKTVKVNELKLEDIPIVHNFPSVFPKDLSSLPPSREVEFRIDLIPRAMPVAKSPYGLAPTETQDLTSKNPVSVLSRNMQNLEMQFSNETLHEKDSNSELHFNAYTTMEAQTFKETIIQNMDSIAQCMVERASHEQELKMTLKRLNESR
ncbi:putative reverse transcriptase domain-containing protein [Tanacetum coccineum]